MYFLERCELFDFTWFFVPPSLPHSPSFSFFRWHYQFSLLSCDLYNGTFESLGALLAAVLIETCSHYLRQAHSHTCPLVFACGLVLIPEVRGLGVWSMRSHRSPRVREYPDVYAPRQLLGSCRTNLSVKDWRVYFRLLSLLVMIFCYSSGPPWWVFRANFVLYFVSLNQLNLTLWW